MLKKMLILCLGIGVFMGCRPGSTGDGESKLMSKEKKVAAAGSEEAKMASIYDIAVRDIDGKDISLGEYRGKVLLIVNTASKCGFTKQYKGLQNLYKKNSSRGLLVLGFPANNFMGQEPGTNEEIKEFCSIEYNVTFPMFEKISVKGQDKHPLYRFLTEKETNPDFAGEISWNFNKFLIGRDGKILARFGSRTEPESAELNEALEKAL